jgi:hypothetical protein
MRVTRHDSCWVPPFGHPRITARLPTPQGLSQAPTSFIGSRCQGIHHAPFIACLTNQQNNHYKRCSRPLSRSQTTTPHHTPTPHKEARPRPGTKTPGTARCLRTPTACQPPPPPAHRPPGGTGVSMVPLSEHHHPPGHERSRPGRVLLRKEVIQPHLPVRLPCYDFVPIASPTFDHSLRTSRLGHGLRVLPTFVT